MGTLPAEFAPIPDCRLRESERSGRFKGNKPGQIPRRLLMSCAFNLLNDLGERRSRWRLLTVMGQINERSRIFSRLAAGDLLVYAQ